MHLRPPAAAPLLCALLATACPASAVPAAPPTLVAIPSDAPDNIKLSWPSVAGASSYTVKQRDSAGGTFSQSRSATTNALDVSGPFTAGEPATFIVIANDASGGSAPSRDLLAHPAALCDNPAPGSAQLSGTWTSSGVSGYYGVASIFAAPVAGSTPTATCTFTAQLPVAGRYAVYARWTPHANRATNAPFEIRNNNVVLGTVRVDQTPQTPAPASPWYFLAEYELGSGSAASVVVRNDDASGYVSADAVQFVFRPFSPAAYTETRISDDFDGPGTTPDITRWTIFAGRSDVRVEAGSLRTRVSLKPSVTPFPTSDSDPRLEIDTNWSEGGIIAKEAQKFGYHEARLRMPPDAADGVDTAYWHNASDEYINGYEIDGPEFFNRGGNPNYYAFGVWDHTLPTPSLANHLPGRTWDKTAPMPAAYHTRCVTVGMELHTDNSTTVYFDGVKVYHAPSSGMNDVESILPARVILSTKVLKWLKPNLALHNAEAVWDYVRYYQKPGFSGTSGIDWAQTSNWSSGEAPAPGRAAVFNLPSTPASLTLSADVNLQSLFLDHPALPALTFSGPGALRLGAGSANDVSVTHGGIALNTTVPTDQTVQNAIVGLAHLQFANLSRVSGVNLHLNGPISGDGVAPRDIEFVSTLETQANGTNDLGAITLGQPLGSGLRHFTRVGGAPFTLPAGSLHTGETRLARGTVVIPALSSLGATANAPLVFRPNYAHVDALRPRLLYTGNGGTSVRSLVLGGWAADGILESAGTGPLRWEGSLDINPSSGKPTQVLTRTPRLTLSATAGSGNNVFAGTIEDGDTVTYKTGTPATDNTGPAVLSLNKTGAGTWTLAGPVTLRANPIIDEGTLCLSALPTFNLLAPAPKISVRPGATLALDTASATTFGYLIEGSGGFRKLGSGSLSLTAANTYTGTTVVENGTLLRNNTGSGRLEVLGGVFDLNGGNRGAPVVVLDGGSITNPTTNVIHYVNAATLYDLRAGSSSARLHGSAYAIKSGTGTVTLSAQNTYTGGTIVEEGVLELTGSLSGTVTVAGGHFENRGTASGTVSVQSGGTISRVGTITGNLVNAGMIILSGDDPFAVSGTITNTGTIDARDWSGDISRLAGLGTVWNPVLTITPSDRTIAHLTNSPLPLTISSTGKNPTVQWTQHSAPAGLSVSFSNANAFTTTASFSGPGIFVLRAHVSDTRDLVADSYVRVIHNREQELTFTAGAAGYGHTATYLRADNPAWNSGARDQLLLGRFNGALRPVFSFPLSGLPPYPVLIDTKLTLQVIGGTGTVDALSLHSLTATPSEGTGNGLTSTDGAGTGTTWAHRTPTVTWSSAGGDYGSVALATQPGVASTSNASITFESESLDIAATTAARDSLSPNLDLLLRTPADEAGTVNNFVRLASDDHATLSSRPSLSFIVAQGLPPAWASADIGAVAVEGQASTFGATTALNYVLTGAGANISGNADAFHFVHQTPATTRTIRARVEAIESLTSDPKAGLMIRSSTAANASNVFLGLSSTGSLVFHARTTTGGGTAHVIPPLLNQNAPLWLQLTRQASSNVCAASYSLDKNTWVPLGSVELPGLPATACFGLAVTSRSVDQTATAALSELEFN